MQISIQRKILRKLMKMNPPKWGNSHTEEINLVKGLPTHIRGSKLVKEAIAGLYKDEFLLRYKKTGEWHVSLNPAKKEEIYRTSSKILISLFLNDPHIYVAPGSLE